MAHIFGSKLVVKAIQMTVAKGPFERMDNHVKHFGVTRSAFAREAVRAALSRFVERDLEKQQIGG